MSLKKEKKIFKEGLGFLGQQKQELNISPIRGMELSLIQWMSGMNLNK